MNPFDALKRGELREIVMSSKEFLLVRDELTKRPDFKHFIGTARKGGEVCFIWSEEART
ncbi:hypothetical protein ACFO0S_01145 [Chryseomicrobium palamuruense]|uniref:Uncharacterized protein n=1 Tax=Chryseomicrobium palamuruense TaxID=682973 RepID=A0ABV8UT47_9BACL